MASRWRLCFLLLFISCYSLVASQDSSTNSAQSSSTSAAKTSTGTTSSASPTTPPDRTNINPTIDPTTIEAIQTETDSRGIPFIVVVETATPEYQLFPTGYVTKTYTIPNESPSAGLYSPLWANNVKILNSYVINNIGLPLADIPEGESFIPAACWWPISGGYGRLPRILFYVIILAALVLRDFQWLYAGALVGCLTYSGSAAVHAALLVWRGPGYGELDLIPLFGILSTSCIIAVPLINWSATLRHVGENEVSKEREEFDASARAITFVWAFLVAVGFLCTFVVLEENTYVPLEKHSTKWLLLGTPSSNSTICTPESGLIDTSAGQISLMTGFWITQEFIDVNKCLDPCAGPRDVDNRPIFRRDQTPVLLASKTFANLLGDQSASQKVGKRLNFAQGYLQFGIYSLPYVLLQGIWAMAVGRRSPAEARNHLFVKIARTAGLVLDEKNRIKKTPSPGFRLFMAKWFALLGYMWALFILIICIPVVILNVTSVEILMYEFPQAAANDSADAWGPWVSTGLVLIAAFIAKFHRPAIIRLLAFMAETTSRGGRVGEKAKEMVLSNRVDQNDIGKTVEKPKQSGVLRSTIAQAWTQSWSTFRKFTARNFKRIWQSLHDEFVGFRTFWHDPVNEEWVTTLQGQRWQLGLDNTPTSSITGTVPGQAIVSSPSTQTSPALAPSNGASATSRLLDPTSAPQAPTSVVNTSQPLTNNSIPPPQNVIARKPLSQNQRRERLQVDALAGQGAWRASFARTSKSKRNLRRSELYGDGAFTSDETNQQEPANDPQATTTPLLRVLTSDRPPALSVHSFGPPFGGVEENGGGGRPGQSGTDWPMLVPRSNGKNRSATSSKPPTPPPK